MGRGGKEILGSKVGRGNWIFKIEVRDSKPRFPSDPSCLSTLVNLKHNSVIPGWVDKDRILTVYCVLSICVEDARQSDGEGFRKPHPYLHKSEHQAGGGERAKVSQFWDFVVLKEDGAGFLQFSAWEYVSEMRMQIGRWQLNFKAENGYGVPGFIQTFQLFL